MENVIFKIKDKGFIPKITREMLSPLHFIVISYVILILLGAILLSMPFSSATGQKTEFVDALFTSTSATCVTGLVVVDTATHFSGIGQLIIIILVHIGGLGYVSIFAFFLLAIGRKLSLKQNLVLQESLNLPTIKEFGNLVKQIFGFVIVVESIGAIILAIRWMQDFSFLTAIKMGFFHSIAAFNNAGFDIMGNFKSMTNYTQDITINLTMSLLIVFGGLGFYVLSDIYQVARKRKQQLYFHSKIVLRTTLILIFAGAALIFISQLKTPEFSELSFGGKMLSSSFQSITARTAGFNTLNIGSFTIAGLMILIVLMFIGASPGGTGGGIKTTTASVVFRHIVAAVRRRSETDVMDRKISNETIDRSFVIFILGLALVFLITFLISLFEPFTLVKLLFEVVSAFGTVGLSTGITPLFGVFGKSLLMIAMFAGRVGILTLLLSFSMEKQAPKVVLATGELNIG